MKNTFKSAMFLFAVTFFSFVNAQTITGRSTTVNIAGTSPMHDWVMNGSSATFTGTANGNTITNVKFTMPAKSLKSTKGKMMDNKAYGALKSDKYPNITFTAPTLAVGKGNLAGKMTIAGVTKEVNFPVTVTKNGKSYHITGAENMKLSTYGMERPGFMGVKTGDAIKVTVNIVAN